MAEESTEISSMTVIGIVLFIAIVGIWYFFIK